MYAMIVSSKLLFIISCNLVGFLRRMPATPAKAEVWGLGQQVIQKDLQVYLSVNQSRFGRS